MRLAGFNALRTGHSKIALGVAEALLARNPEDVSALILQARAARAQGQYDTASAAGRAAWRLAASEAEKFAAGMSVAQALSSKGKRTRAQLWLRRAADAAPDQASRDVAARDFRYVRSRNPWSTELRFNVTPNNNINNGSRRETTQLFGLPFEFQLDGAARALEGVEYAVGAASRYRFDQTASYAQDVVLQFDHRTYSMTAESRARAPDVTGSDFAFSQMAVGYVYNRTPETGIGPYTLNATAGQSWYGGDPYFAYARLGATQKVAIGPRANLSFSGSAERQFGAASPDADILRADMRFLRAIGDFAALGLSLGHSTSMSDQDIAAYSENRAGVDLQLAKPIFGAQVSFGLQLRQRDYPSSRYDPSGRKDTEVSASMNLVFTNIERYGFNPTLSLNAAQTDSNIGLFDSNSLGVSFGIRSAF